MSLDSRQNAQRMPSTLLLTEHRQVLDSLDVLARRDLLDLWRTLDGGAEATTNQLLADLPHVIDKYGDRKSVV